MPRPNFFIVGAPKCGTTAWHAYLGTHPDIGFASQKEPHYFNTDMPGFRWTKSETDYLELFRGCAGKQAIGEASVQYLASEVAAEQIAQFAPDARIVIFVRAHARYLASYHNQLLLNRDEVISDFGTAWRAGPDREIPESCRFAGLLDYRRMGALSQQISRYMAQFPAEQIMIVRFEDWVRDPRHTYLDLLGFLGLPDDGRDEFPPVHEAKTVASKRVAQLTQRPPGPVLGAAAVLRRILGLKRLGFADRLRQINYRKGYDSALSQEVADEITAYFAEDAARLAEQIAQLDQARKLASSSASAAV